MMLYLIYDTAKHELPGLVALKEQLPVHDLLLNRKHDGDLEYVAPWIFQVDEDQMEAIKSLEEDVQNFLWFDSKAELHEVIRVFQKIIYNGDPDNARQFFRVWDVQIIVQELAKPKSSPVFELFKVVDNIYLLNDEMMNMYYLDFWGVLNDKTVKNILAKPRVCHSQPQE